MKKEYTKLRQFYSWVGFLTLVVIISTILAIVINYWVGIIIN